MLTSEENKFVHIHLSYHLPLLSSVCSDRGKHLFWAMQKWTDQLGRPCLRANFTVEFSGDHKRECCWELLGSECQGLGLGSCGAVYDGDQKGGLEAKARFARPLDSGRLSVLRMLMWCPACHSEPVFKSLIWQSHCFSPFHLWGFKNHSTILASGNLGWAKQD